MTRWTRLVVGVSLVVLAQGCSSSPDPAPRRDAVPTTASRTAGAAPVSAAERCGGPSTASRPVAVTTADGLTLPAYVAGSGRRGVVLVHQYASQLCGWWPYAARLADLGLHVLIFDDRCSGEAPCPAGAAAGSDYVADAEAAVAALRSDGAARVAVVGASRGGAVTIATAADPPRGVVAVAGLSAALLDAPVGADAESTALAAAPRVRLPVLLAVARRDDAVSVGETRRLYADLGSTRKRLVVLDASAGHGWDLLRSADLQGWTPLATRLEAFLVAQL